MIGYKKCLYLDVDDSKEGYTYFKYALVTLEIPEDSEVITPSIPTYWPITHTMTDTAGNKFRCSYAKVLDIVDVYNQEKHVDCAFSIYDIKKRFNYGYNDQPITTYIKGRKVVADALDKNPAIECSYGIHFFLSKQEAINFMF